MKLTLATRLWLPTLALAIAATAMTGMSVVRTTRLHAESAQAQQAQQHKLQLALQWSGWTEANAIRVVSTLLSADPAVETALKPEIQATTARISEVQKEVDALSQAADERAGLDKVAAARQVYLDARKQAQQLKSSGDVAGAAAMLNDKVRPAVAAYVATQREFVALQESRMAALRDAAGAERMRTVWRCWWP
jgi:hypothetical protein